jgi:hypothetical protein
MVVNMRNSTNFAQSSQIFMKNSGLGGIVELPRSSV